MNRGVTCCVEPLLGRLKGLGKIIRNAREGTGASIDDLNCRVCGKDLEEADDGLELDICHHKFHRSDTPMVLAGIIMAYRLCLSRWFGEKGRRDCPRCELPYGRKKVEECWRRGGGGRWLSCRASS